MSEAWEKGFEQPIPDGRFEHAMDCERDGCDADAVTWCPLCQKVFCQRHDELTPRRMHDCLAGPADPVEDSSDVVAS